MTFCFRANIWARRPHWCPSHWCSPKAVPCLWHTRSRQEEEEELILFFHPCDPITTQPCNSSIHILTHCRREMLSLFCPLQSGAFPTILYLARIEKVQVSHSTMVPFLEVKMPLLSSILSACSTGIKVGASQPGKLGQQHLLERSNISMKLFHIWSGSFCYFLSLAQLARSGSECYGEEPVQTKLISTQLK